MGFLFATPVRGKETFSFGERPIQQDGARERVRMPPLPGNRVGAPDGFANSVKGRERYLAHQALVRMSERSARLT